MLLLAKIAQFLTTIPVLAGAALLLVGIFADELFGDFTEVMGVPLTLAGLVLMLVGIGLATLARRATAHFSGVPPLVPGELPPK